MLTSFKWMNIVAAVLLIMAAFPQDLRTEEPESEQSRLDLGVGTVSNGLGNGLGPGYYDYEVRVYSHKRYNTYADDAGHQSYYCVEPDVPWDSCVSFIEFDGVRLKPYKFAYDSGLYPSYGLLSGKIEGPFNKHSSSDWEWPDEKATRDLAGGTRYFTRRDTLLFNAYYTDIYWSGDKSQVASRLKAQWTESDPNKGPFDPPDDDSEWAYFNLDDMAQKCLQAFGGEGEELTVLTKSLNYYWYLCSKDGDCEAGDGSGGLHYKLKTYYRVTCKRWLDASFLDSECVGVNYLRDDLGLPEATCAAYCDYLGKTCTERCTTNRGYPDWGVEAWYDTDQCEAYSTSGGQARCTTDLAGYSNWHYRKYRCCCE